MKNIVLEVTPSAVLFIESIFIQIRAIGSLTTGNLWILLFQTHSSRTEWQIKGL